MPILRPASSPVSLLHIFRTHFCKNTSGVLLLNVFIIWKPLNYFPVPASQQTSLSMMRTLALTLYYLVFTKRSYILKHVYTLFKYV